MTTIDGAVDDLSAGRAPGPVHVSRGYESGFSGIQTFAKLPVCLTPQDLVAGGIDVAVCGVPWDSTATGRSGAGHGPLAMRSCDYAAFAGFPHADLHTRVDSFAVLKCCDYGDSPVLAGDTQGTFEEIRAFVGSIAAAGAIPVIMGGDHGITWPCATAVAEHHGYGKVGIVAFGAHGPPMRGLIESGAVPGRNVVQVGLRGYLPPGTRLWMRERQMRTHFMAEVDRDGFEAVLERAIDEALDQADHLYLSVGIDACDPAYAPGTAAPEPGGLTSGNLLRAVRRIAAEAGIAGLDVVEVSPPHDNQGAITVLLGNRVIHNALTGTAMRRLGITEPGYLHPDALEHGQPGGRNRAPVSRERR